MKKVNLDKKLWTIVGIFAVATFVAMVVISNTSQEVPMGPGQKVVSPKLSTPPTSVTSGTAKQVATYTNLVQQYQGRHIQFDAHCQAIPNYVTYKNGTNVMFDNRSGDARYISVGGAKYYLPGYGYRVLTLYTKTLPQTLYLNCGAAVNVGRILLQR